MRELTQAEWKRMLLRMIRNTVLILLPAVILALLKADHFRQLITQMIERWYS